MLLNILRTQLTNVCKKLKCLTLTGVSALSQISAKCLILKVFAIKCAILVKCVITAFSNSTKFLTSILRNAFPKSLMLQQNKPQCLSSASYLGDSWTFAINKGAKSQSMALQRLKLLESNRLIQNNLPGTNMAAYFSAASLMKGKKVLID